MKNKKRPQRRKELLLLLDVLMVTVNRACVAMCMVIRMTQMLLKNRFRALHVTFGFTKVVLKRIVYWMTIFSFVRLAMLNAI